MKSPMDYSLGEIQASLLTDISPVNHDDVRNLIKQLCTYVEAHQLYARNYQRQREMQKIEADKPQPRISTSEFIDGTYVEEYEPL